MLIAVGAHPRVLPGAEPDGERILNWRQLYDLKELPEDLIVVGSGVTGAEFASAYQALGSQVTLGSSRTRVLPHEDIDAAFVIEDVFRRRGMHVLGRSRAKEVKRKGDQVQVTSRTAGPSTARTACSPWACCPASMPSASRQPALAKTTAVSSRSTASQGQVHQASTPRATAPACSCSPPSPPCRAGSPCGTRSARPSRPHQAEPTSPPPSSPTRRSPPSALTQHRRRRRARWQALRREAAARNQPQGQDGPASGGRLHQALRQARHRRRPRRRHRRPPRQRADLPRLHSRPSKALTVEQLAHTFAVLPLPLRQPSPKPPASSCNSLTTNNHPERVVVTPLSTTRAPRAEAQRGACNQPDRRNQPANAKQTNRPVGLIFALSLGTRLAAHLLARAAGAAGAARCGGCPRAPLP